MKFMFMRVSRWFLGIIDLFPALIFKGFSIELFSLSDMLCQIDC